MVAETRRLLVVSCEYDADASPQGLRWVKLTAELARQGWHVDVVTLESAVKQPSRAGLHVHSVYPGPYRGTIDAVRRRLGRLEPAAAAPLPPGGQRPPTPARLSWKGRLELALRRALEYWMYPDLRREALPFLRSRVRQLMGRHAYAGVVLSHEPPLALELLDTVLPGRIPIVADLGDPVCAIYTPRRWRRRALRLEEKVCGAASAVVATSRATLELLHARHPSIAPASLVISQGFDPRPGNGTSGPSRNNPRLRLVYTGRFYPFRDPRPVIEAMRAMPDVDLVLALPEIPAWLGRDWHRAPNFEVHVRLSHAEALALQATADVLLVVGNDDVAQVPGKLFEYFALPVPILYVASQPDDEGAALLVELNRGLAVQAKVDAIAPALAELRDCLRQGGFAERFDLSAERVSAHAWPALAGQYGRLFETLGARPPVQ